MAFILKKGPVVIEYWPKKASTTMTANSLVQPDGSGFLTNATAGSTKIFGLLQINIASTDADFASTTKVPVIIPQDTNEFEADVTGTLTTAMVGETRDLSSALTVDAAGTSHNQVTIAAFISATKAMVKINGAYSYKNAA